MSEQKIWKLRRERADKVHALLDGKATARVAMSISRYYLYGFLEKPLEELTDEELLAQKYLGPKTVEALRAVIPSPGS